MGRTRATDGVRRALRLIAGLCLLGAGLFLGVGYWSAAQRPVVVRAAVPIEGLARPVTLALVSDTHRGWPDMPAARLRAVVDQVNALGADVIVLAGDYSGGKPFEWRATTMEEAIGPFRRLRAPLGVFMVGGNHDNSRWLAWKAARMGSPRLLANTHADLGPLVLGGSRDATDGADPVATFAGAPAGKPRLLVIHEADALEWLRPTGQALTLSGHTHGGQIMLGRRSLPDVLGWGAPCRRGACMVARRRVFVTSGVGTSQVPARVGVPPEIVLLTLTPA